MVEASKAAGPAGAGSKAADTPADVLKGLLETYLKAAALQTDYQALYRSLPEVFAVAGEILKRKEAGDKALEQALVIVEKLLGDASAKAQTLSTALQEQHATLEKILSDKALLIEVLRAGKQGMAGAGGPDPALAANDTGSAAAGGPGTANFGYQLNMMMSKIQAMVSREVERQIANLRVQAEQKMKAGK